MLCRCSFVCVFVAVVVFVYVYYLVVVIVFSPRFILVAVGGFVVTLYDTIYLNINSTGLKQSMCSGE